MARVMMAQPLFTRGSNGMSRKTKSFRITLRCLFFAALLYGCVYYFSAVLRPSWRGDHNNPARFAEFYRLPPDSIDVLFIGGSSYLNGIFPLAIWNETGVPSFTRASVDQAPVVSLAYFSEALRTQSPSVTVFDVRPILLPDIDYDEIEPRLRQSLDPMRWSRFKVAAVRDIICHSQTHSAASWLFPVLRYHARWKEITWEDWVFVQSKSVDGEYRGMSPRFMSTPQERHLEDMVPRDGDASGRWNESVAGYYENMIAMSRKHNSRPVFVTLPRLWWRYSSCQRIQAFADRHGIPYVDYNRLDLFDQVGLDPASDFINRGHLNVFGARKIAAHLGRYLQGHFSLEDRRQEPTYADWSKDWENIQRIMHEYGTHSTSAMKPFR